MADFVEGVLKFNRAAGRPETFDANMVAKHTGFQLSELAEKLEAIAEGALTESEKIGTWYLRHMIKEMESLAKDFQKGDYDKYVLNGNRHDMADADADVMVVSVGSLMTMGTDVQGLLGEVNRANLDKMVDGKFIYNADKKIQKPEGWRKPDLTPFLVNQLAGVQSTAQ